MKKLKTEILEGRATPEHVLQELWALRLDFLNLTISKEEDWAKFSDICVRPNTLLIIFRDDSGELQGYYTFAFKPIEEQGRKALLIHSKYYYVRPDFRGHPKIPSSAWRLLPGIVWRYGFRQLYFIAFSFPSSYASLSRTFGRVMTVQGEATPLWEKTVLEAYVADQCGEDWDRDAKLVKNQNVPIGEDKVSDKIKELRRDFEAMNPEWATGISLPIMMKFDLETIKSVIQSNVRRRMRK